MCGELYCQQKRRQVRKEKRWDRVKLDQAKVFVTLNEEGVISMIARIGVISRSQEFIDLLFMLSIHEPVHILAEQTNFSQAAEKAKTMAAGGIDAIIAREFTADLIQKSITMPVIHCDFQAIDILLSLSEAKPEDYPLALIREIKRIKGTTEILNLIYKLWGHKVDLIPYFDFNDLDTKLQEAATRGIKGVIGGKLILEMAAQYGLNKIELVTSQETAKTVLKQTIKIALARQLSKTNLFFLSSVTNSNRLLVMVLDSKGTVRYASSYAKKIIRLSKDKELGEVIPTFPYYRFLSLLEKGHEIKDKIYTVPGTKQSLIYDLIPLFNEESVFIGSLVNFQDPSMTSVTKEKQIRLLDKGLKARHSLDDIIGKSIVLDKVKAKATAYAKNDLNILITGETGTGKELFAHGIHQASPRQDGPFVAINCAALPPNLLESELFGYEGGAFTGAKTGGKKGLFEVAQGGTIFLDEIGETPLNIQARLLRVLENKEIMRLGSDRVIPLNVRIISATNKNIESEVEKTQFRSDLYYRLNNLVLSIPPLRERREDIPALILEFLGELNLNSKVQAEIYGKIKSSLNYFSSYDWPGNVRELRNFVERFAVERKLIQNGLIKASELLLPDKAKPVNLQKQSFIGSLKDMELKMIRAVGQHVNWNRKQMADILGISQSTLWRKMKSL